MSPQGARSAPGNGAELAPGWEPLEGAPAELTELLGAPAAAGAAGWHVREAPDGMLYARVSGNGGAEGLYVLRLWFVPRSSSSVRHPTFPEWTELADAVCLPGAIVAAQWVTGQPAAELERFGPLIVVQTGAMHPSPAFTRLRLTQSIGSPGVGIVQ